MSFRVRAARADDLPALYEMAKLTGSGFTNLPPDRDALEAKLARSAVAFGGGDADGDDQFVLILENVETGEVRGTAQLFTRIGQKWPFYSYRLATLTKHSRELGRSFRAEMLNLVTDLEGSSEVGGLFVHPAERAAGLGLLLARSRYLFIAMHRARFSDRLLAELRGIIDERGGSPFWDGVAGRFFGMSFQEADYFNATRGNQFIADLMPRHPVYLAMLPESSRSVIGLPHPSGRAAMRMLETEGFQYEGYLDIFDGGPTMTARTDRVKSIAEARRSIVAGCDAAAGTRSLVAAGTLEQFRCGFAAVEERESGLAIDAEASRWLDVRPGEEAWWIGR